MTWTQLNQHPDYEIFSEYDENLHCYPVRKIGKNRILKTLVHPRGYVILSLNAVQYLVHRVIAEQFIENDDLENKTDVDHVNHIRTDNRIENLRWTTHLQNQNNQSKTNNGRDVEYVVELPDDVIVVNIYGNHRFNGYFFANDVFYRDTGNGDYRIVPWHYSQSQNRYDVCLIDENTMKRTISKKTFYKLYDLD